MLAHVVSGRGQAADALCSARNGFLPANVVAWGFDMGAAVGDEELWAFGARIGDGETVNIVGNDAGTVVMAVDSHADVVEVNIVGVAEVEAPGGKFFEHGKFGILRGALINVGEGLRVGGEIGVCGVGATRVANGNVFEGDVLNAMAWGTYNA